MATATRRDPPAAPLRTLCLALLLLASTAAAAAAAAAASPPSPRPPPALGLFKRLRGTGGGASQIAPGVSPAGQDYWCRVEGECLPCPPGARDSDVCKVYGNRRPLICVQRHSSSTGATRHAESFHRDDGGGDDDDGDDNHANREDDPDEVVDQAREKSLGTVKGKGKEPPPAVGVKPLVEPAGSQAEADDLAREDRQQFGSTTNTNTHKQVGGGDDGEEEVPGTKPPAGWSKADQELQDELQAERRRKRKRRRRAVAAAAPRQGPISTWEACPKVLHSEHHDYFEFILCNAGFAALAIAVLVFRQRTLALQQFGRLAARIMQTQSSSV